MASEKAFSKSELGWQMYQGCKKCFELLDVEQKLPEMSRKTPFCKEAESQKRSAHESTFYIPQKVIFNLTSQDDLQ